MNNSQNFESRRAFLAQAGATALVTAASPLAFAAESDKKVRIGIVGGKFGSTFQFHLDPGCIVEAVSDLRPERIEHLKKTYRCDKSYPSLAELLKDPKIDAVGIYTEAPNHVPHVIQALEAGKHVQCAVPAAMNLEECEQLIAAVKKSGLVYMMAETSYYRQEVITARRMFERGEFGELFCCEAEYHHDGLDPLFWEDGDPTKARTWRYGFPPMHYPTHSTAMITGVTGERLIEVSSIGWGDDSPILKDNAYKNPFWSETSFFKTDRGHACRIAVYWKVASGGGERAKWFGNKKSFHMTHMNGIGPVICESGDKVIPFKQPKYWETELPEPMRVDSGHDGSHTFLTHEFIQAIRENRRPTIDVYEAVAYTAPGIVAHQSSLKGGEQLKVPDFGRG